MWQRAILLAPAIQASPPTTMLWPLPAKAEMGAFIPVDQTEFTFRAVGHDRCRPSPSLLLPCRGSVPCGACVCLCVPVLRSEILAAAFERYAKLTFPDPVNVNHEPTHDGIPVAGLDVQVRASIRTLHLRYFPMLCTSQGLIPPSLAGVSCNLQVESDDDTLSADTNETYSLVVQAPRAKSLLYFLHC